MTITPTLKRAVRRLENAGVPHSDISIVANNSENWYNGSKKVDRDGDGVDDRAEGAGKGAGIGAGVGGATGLLAGLGLLAIPGLGPVVAAGWLAATAVGAAAGAATGGIVGALTEAGFSKEGATLYAEGVRRGGTLVSARVADTDRARLDAILNQSAVNLRDRSGEHFRSYRVTPVDAGARSFAFRDARRLPAAAACALACPFANVLTKTVLPSGNSSASWC